MKTHVADYRWRIYCLRIVPANDSPVIRLVGYPHSLKMSNGQIYQAEQGYDFSGYGTGTTFASSSIDLSGIMQQGAISKDDLDSGVYDNARMYTFATTWANPIEDEEPLAAFIFGAVNTDAPKYSVEMMSLIDVLSQDIGHTYSPTCQNTLFDETLDGHVLPITASRCTGPRASPDGPLLSAFKVTGTVTAVTSQSIITDNSRTEADDWFGYGNIRFTSGPNVGLKPMQIKSFAGGVITLIESFFYLPTVGDTYEMIPGCRKDAASCKAKYSNVRNFYGQPHVPTSSQYSQVGRGS